MASGILRKKKVFTICVPVPAFIPRPLAIDVLHDHKEVITLNPLVTDHRKINPPPHAASDEYASIWYEIDERIQFVPGIGPMGSGKISFTGCFHDVPWGLQTHIYAPMNIDMRAQYRVAGNQAGFEPSAPHELGLAALGAPAEGLYLRADIEFTANVTLVSFVQSQTEASIKVMVERMVKRAEALDADVLQAMIDDEKTSAMDDTSYDSSNYSKPISQTVSLPTQRTSSYNSQHSLPVELPGDYSSATPMQHSYTQPETYANSGSNSYLTPQSNAYSTNQAGNHPNSRPHSRSNSRPSSYHEPQPGLYSTSQPNPYSSSPPNNYSGPQHTSYPNPQPITYQPPLKTPYQETQHIANLPSQQNQQNQQNQHNQRNYYSNNHLNTTAPPPTDRSRPISRGPTEQPRPYSRPTSSSRTGAPYPFSAAPNYSQDSQNRPSTHVRSVSQDNRNAGKYGFT